MDENNTAKRKIVTSSNDDDCRSCKYYKCLHNSLEGLYNRSGDIGRKCTQFEVKNVKPNLQHNKYANLLFVLESMQKVEFNNIKDSEKRLDEIEDSIKKLIVAVDLLQTNTDAVVEENKRIIDDLITAEKVIGDSLTEVLNLRRELLEVQLPSQIKLNIYHSESRYLPRENDNVTLKSVGNVLSIPNFSRIFDSACRLLHITSASAMLSVVTPKIESKKPEINRENIAVDDCVQPAT